MQRTSMLLNQYGCQAVQHMLGTTLMYRTALLCTYYNQSKIIKKLVKDERVLFSFWSSDDFRYIVSSPDLVSSLSSPVVTVETLKSYIKVQVSRVKILASWCFVLFLSKFFQFSILTQVTWSLVILVIGLYIYADLFISCLCRDGIYIHPISQ